MLGLGLRPQIAGLGLGGLGGCGLGLDMCGLVNITAWYTIVAYPICQSVPAIPSTFKGGGRVQYEDKFGSHDNNWGLNPSKFQSRPATQTPVLTTLLFQTWPSKVTPTCFQCRTWDWHTVGTPLNTFWYQLVLSCL